MKFNKTFIAIGLAIVLVWIVGSDTVFVNADTPFQFREDFNDQESEQPPVGWTIHNRPGVSEDQSTILVKDIPSAEDKSLEFSVTDSANTQDPFVFMKFDEVLTDSVTIEAELMTRGIGTTYQTIMVRDENNTNTVFLVNLERDGTLYAYDGPGNMVEVVDTKYDEGEWIPVKVVIDLNHKTYDFYVDGVKVKEDLGLSNQNLENVKYLRLQTRAMVNGEDAKNYFKDIHVVTPVTPKVIDSFPRDEQDHVALNFDTMDIQFNTPMDLNTLDPAHILFTNETERQPITYSDYTSTETTYSFRISEPLKPQTIYSIQLQGVKAFDGQSVTKRITFRTNEDSSQDQLLQVEHLGFSQNGRSISENELASGLVTGQISVRNLEEDENSVSFIMGLYLQEKLIDYTYVEQLIPSSESEVLGATLSVPDDGQDDYGLKMFIWDGVSSMKAISNKQEATSHPFERPNSTEILTTLKENHPDLHHPRIMITEDKIATLKSDLTTNAEMQKWYNNLIQRADIMLQQPVEVYNRADGLRLLPISRAVKGKIEVLALMYLLSEQEIYAERVWDELSAVAEFPDWNPEHFLDTAEMTAAFAIGYDWLYHYWTEEQREVIRGAIVEHGLLPGLEAYRNPLGGTPNRMGWATDEARLNNWNVVTNSGMVIGALAIADEEEELAGEILEGGIRGVEYALKLFAPEGAWSEGVNYWAYTARYLVYYLASLDTALGTDYEHFSAPGIANTAYFPVFLTGSIGTFNFHDDSRSLNGNGAEILWLANKIDDAGLTNIRSSQINGSSVVSPYDLIWFNPEHIESGGSYDLPLDIHFKGAETATFRSLWDDPYALFTGIHGGENRVSHGDLDIGTFILDALGERWAMNLGAEDYNVPGYWDYNGQRWSYYRKRAEGQNTLVINPGSGLTDQNIEAFAEITNYASEPQGGFAIMDMSEAYDKHVWEANRGIAVFDNRTKVLMQDELIMKHPSEMYWFMHSEADLEVSEDGQSVLMSIGDKRMWVGLQSSREDAVFTVTDASPLPSITKPANQESANTGVRRLTVHLTDVTDLQLSVLFVPLMEGEDLPSLPTDYIALKDWEMSEEGFDLPMLDSIRLDNEPLGDFVPNKFIYDVVLPFGSEELPVVSVDGGNYDISIEQQPGLPSKTVIRVSNGERQSTVYEINFSEASEILVEASTDDGNVPENTLDGDLSTRWSALGFGQWIRYEFNEIKSINGLSIAFYQGDERSTYFDIETSLDGVKWERVYSGESSGTTNALEHYNFTERDAKFVRVIGKTNASNDWNSITEVNFHYGDQE